MMETFGSSQRMAMEAKHLSYEEGVMATPNPKTGKRWPETTVALVEEFLAKIVYFSDGCTGHFKNLKNFANICLHEEDFGVPAEWHFFATSHGKGPSDGNGGTIKREATRASLQHPFDNLQLFKFVDEHLSGINSKLLTNVDWKVEDEHLQERYRWARAIAGTHKLHSFIPVSESLMQVATYSLSEEWQKVCIFKSGQKTLDIGLIHGYVTVVYDKKWWAAYVIQVAPEKNSLEVSFLHPHGPHPSFYFPKP
eukprot:gene5689-10935_t